MNPSLRLLIVIGAWILVGAFLLLAWMAFVLVARLRQERRKAQLCRDRRCCYFTDYIRHGPAYLSHSQYHAAEEQLETWWKLARTHVEAGELVPSWLARKCEIYEFQLRRRKIA